MNSEYTEQTQGSQRIIINCALCVYFAASVFKWNPAPYNYDMSREEYNKLSRSIIKCAIEVHKGLGPGLLERVYEDALVWEMKNQDLIVERQVPIEITYKELEIRDGYFADIVVNDMLILELKAVENILPVHKAQLLSYLKLADMKLGLLLNFHVTRMTDGISRIINGKL